MDSGLRIIYFLNLNVTIRKKLTPILKINNVNISELYPLVCLVPKTERCNSATLLSVSLITLVNSKALLLSPQRISYYVLSSFFSHDY